MRRSFFCFLSLVLFGSSVARAQSDLSVINVPIEAPLAALEAYADSLLPRQIHEAHHVQTCVEAQRACADVPEIHGLSIQMVTRCVEVSPRVDCALDEKIERDGPVRIDGRENTLILSQNLVGSVTARGRGELGRNVRQTVRARAALTVEASPRLGSDWQPILDLSVSHRWIDRPTFRLFNLIDISISGHVDPALKSALQSFRVRTLPEEVRKLDLRGKAADLWAVIQDPIRVPAGDQKLWLHLEPTAVGMAQPSFSDGRFKTALSISGHLELTDEDTDLEPKAELPDLSSVSDTQSRIVLPVSISYETLNRLIEDEMPYHFDIDATPSASVDVRSVRLESEGAGLRIAADLTATTENAALRTLGISEFSGQIDIVANLALEPATDLLKMQLIELSPGTPNPAVRILGWAATEGPIGSWIEEKVSSELNSHLDGLRGDINAALNQEIAPGLRLEGAANLSIADFRVGGDGIAADMRSIGDLRLLGFDPLHAE